jgi:(p)ppGpp synthase/HD superfamily hydrolase
MKVYNALALAAQLHGNQKYGKEPYMVHVAQVAEVLRYYGVEDEDVLAAGVLHDVVEDCDVTVGVLDRRMANFIDRRIAAGLRRVDAPKQCKNETNLSQKRSYIRRSI